MVVSEYPWGERVLADLDPPIADRMLNSLLWMEDGKPNWQNLRDHMKAEGRVTVEDAMQIIGRARALFKMESNILAIQEPVTVIGDIHGQYYDLLNIFEIAGQPGENTYLFLGDYVDRGCFSCECVLLLLALKIAYRDKTLLLRGNHECRQLSSYFNFKRECFMKYNEEVYDAFMACFDELPVCCIIDDRFFCVHGGLSPELQSLDDIRFMYRSREPPEEGLMADLLWADPHEESEVNFCVCWLRL
eukprot:NODE_1200_length_1646_cov_78.742642_g1065_i0.p1 GENE.NODE_1200_length_1646_cov_78.742642_g1065_i0~~NODE_1200_length_1646_cov_78.742642_g1065_i0.p1  ORF type:complete len:246 (+),score=41.53 NODE_1200_length_1646_cov_78.742642_g1065_i0:72-809(+)